MISPPETISVSHTQGLLLNWLLGHAPSLWLQAAWDAALVIVVFLGLVSVIGFVAIYLERKVAGRMQHRHGPNRVGPLGMLQSLADGIKLVSKEDLVPARADRWLFFVAPYLAFAPVFTAFIVLPFGPNFVFEPRLAFGLVWVLAILGVEVIGVILAGWSSNNKWSIYGAMREACQLISYEIPLGVSIVTVVVVAGTLNLTKLCELQAGGIQTWLIFRQPFLLAAALVFFIASLASNKRAPFDLPESDSELVAGYHTEYSGLRFSLFYLAEYNAMFVLGGVFATLFLGGWTDPFGYIAKACANAESANATLKLLALNALATAIFFTKTSLVIFIQMWVRWTLPRPRIDQVLHACVKVLLPLSLVLLLGSALWELLVPPATWLAEITQITLAGLGILFTVAVLCTITMAFIKGRHLQQRLSDPLPLAVA